nr:hypothetical protein [uncultured Enterobacter sp.]
MPITLPAISPTAAPLQNAPLAEPRPSNSAVGCTVSVRNSPDKPALPSLFSLAKNAVKNETDYQPKHVLAYLGGMRALRGQAFALGESQATRLSNHCARVLDLDKAATIIQQKITKHIPKNHYLMHTPPVANSDRSGLTGVPVTGAQKPADFPLEKDVDNNEIFFRAMPGEHYEALKQTGHLTATGETSISPAIAYSEKYHGTLVQFTMKPGTAQSLLSVGGGARPKICNQLNLTPLGKGWGQTKVGFKSEGDQTTLQLGTGRGLAMFNDNIVAFTELVPDGTTSRT